MIPVLLLKIWIALGVLAYLWLCGWAIAEERLQKEQHDNQSNEIPSGL